VYTFAAMRLIKIVAPVVTVVTVAVMASAPAAQGPTKVLGFSDAGKAVLTKQMNDAVQRGDAPGVAELVVDR
jgi:hypothetical protein